MAVVKGVPMLQCSADLTAETGVVWMRGGRKGLYACIRSLKTETPVFDLVCFVLFLRMLTVGSEISVQMLAVLR